MANFGTAYIDVAGNFAPLEAQIAGFANGPAGRKMSALGKSLTKSLTLPLVGVGAVAAKMSMDFDRSMELIHTQAGASSKEVDKLKKSVLDLAKVEPQGPQALSEALFRLEGAGLRGQKAMKALKTSADLAAVGNANVEDTAKTLSQVWFTNIKGAENFKKVAAEVNATVGAGDLRLPQLVDALGTGVLAAAKEAGLSLQDVNGAMAVFGDETNNVSGWAAQLATAFHFFTNPTEKAKGALLDLGLSGSTLAQDMHKPKGLITALADLKEHLDKLPGGEGGVQAEQALGDILPGGRGRVLLVLLNQLERYEQKMVQIKGTTDAFGKSVHETMEQPAVKLEVAWSKMRVALIQLGAAITPIVLPALEDVAGLVSKIGEGFEGLSPSSQKLVVKIGLVAAALGPGLAIVGKMVGTFSTLVSVIRKAAVAVGLLTTAEEASAVAAVASSSAATGGPAAADIGSSAPAVLPWLGSGVAKKKAELAKHAAAFGSAGMFGEAFAGPEIGAVAGAEGGAGALAGLLAAAPPAAPWIALGAAVVAASVGMVALYRSSQRVRDAVAPIGQAAMKAFQELKGQVAPLSHSFAELGNAFRGREGLIGAVKELAAQFKGPIEAVQAILSTGLLKSVRNVSGQVGEAIKGIGRSFSGAIQVIRGAVEVITGLLTLKFGKAWSGVKNIFSGSLKTVVGFVRAAAAPLVDGVNGIGNAMHTAFGGVWTKVEGVFTDGINAVIGLVNSMISLVNKLPFVDIGQIGALSEPSTSRGGLGKTRSGASFHKKAEGGIVPGHGEGDTFATHVPPGTFVLNKKATPVFGFQKGGAVPVMLEPGERVFYPQEVRAHGLHNLMAMNAAVPRFSIGGIANSIGSDITSIPGDVVGAARGLAGSGLGAILSSLPDPSSALPKWLAGFGGYLKSQLVDWVKGKHKDYMKKQSALGGLNVPTGPIERMARELVSGVWGSGQWAPFAAVEMREAGWDPHAQNPTSTAYGLAQNLNPSTYPPAGRPGSSAPLLEQAKAQLQWMVSYIKGRYGDPAGALAHEESAGWYAKGGHVQALAKGGRAGKAPIGEAFQDRARKIWSAAAPFFGKSGAMPRTWATGALPGGRSHTSEFSDDGSRATYLGRRVAGEVLDEVPSAEETLIHEWAHMFQPELNKRLDNGHSWEVEGGAEAFARWAAPQIYKAAGLYYGNPGPEGYPGRVARAIKEKGWDWIKHGQFVDNSAGDSTARFAGIAPDLDAPADERKRFEDLRAQGILKLAGGGKADSKTKAPSVLERMLTRMKELTGIPYPHPDSHFGLQEHPAYLDCSAAVSNVLWKGGLLDTEETSGTLEKFGKPGVGKFSIFANAGHTFIEALGRFWGTSVGDDGAGGLGYHSAPSPSYLSEFVARHVPDGLLGDAPEGVTGTTSKPAIPKLLKGKYVKYGVDTHGKNPDELTAVQARYKVVTDRLNSFGSLPDNLGACTKELRIRQRELGEYRAALSHIKNPETAQALTANINLLKSRISALREQRVRLLRQKATKAAVKKITEAANFLPWTSPNGIFAKQEDLYNRLQELADQSVTLEPEEPLKGATADWVEHVLASYVDNVESPAYGRVLGAESSWRNSILGAEEFASQRMGGWRDQITKLHDNIEEIKGLRKTHPHAYAKRKGQIPGMEQQIKALRADIVKTRTETLPEWEDALGGVQGLGRSHAILESLSPVPTGDFGGDIFDTQLTIKGLGLKVPQMLANLSPEEAPGKTPHEEFLEEQLLQANQRNLLRGIEERVFAGMPKPGGFQIGGSVEIMPPYAGKAHTGAIVPGPKTSEKTMVVQGGEGIFTEDQMAAMGGVTGTLGAPVIEEMHVYSDGRVKMTYQGQEFEAAVRKVTSHDERRGARGASRRLATPGVFGK